MAKVLFKGTPWYVHVSFIVAMALLVAGFCVPPHGEISGSVLTGIGELLGGVTLVEFVVNIPKYLEAGIKAKISHGQTTVAIAADEVKEEAQDL
ncbi:MAG: hypothetical protein IKJ78_06120 [Bacteroidales bacterium]|nr:hypothetical protein [Bacteroidales bacterium]